MSLTISDILNKLSEVGKKKTADFLVEFAKDNQLPVANDRSFTKTLDYIVKI